MKTRSPSALTTLAIIAPLLASCRAPSVTVNANYLADERFEARTADHPIEFIIGEPHRPYTLVGQISVNEGEFWAGIYTAEGTKALEAMKARAREMGGDAIIRFESYNAPAGTVGAGSFTAQGIIARWKDGAGEESGER